MQSETKQPAVGWDMKAVSNFSNGDDDILILDRPLLYGLDDIVQQGRVHEVFAPVSREKVGFEVRSGLGELKIKSRELEADLVYLLTAFLDQFGLQRAQLRVEITRTQSCPKFHSDNVHVRLVTTYVGPTTEFQYVGECSVHTASLGGLVFLKGHRHPTHCDTVHHRSPEVPFDEKRLCVAIDF